MAFRKTDFNKTSSNEDNQNIKLRSHDGSLMEDQNEIVNSFNNFFATIGNTLAEKLPQPTTDFKSYLVDQLDTVPTPNFYEIGPAEILFITHKEKLIEISINLKSFFHQQKLGENKILYCLKLDVATRRCLHLN